MVGLAHEAWFPGEYGGNAASATAVKASIGAGLMKSEWFDHAVYTLTVGSGMSASAGRVDVTIAWYDPAAEKEVAEKEAQEAEKE
jgi:hypothetical protein